VSPKGDAYAKPIGQYFPLIRIAVVVQVADLPQLGDAGVVNLVAANQHSGSGPFFQPIEPIGNDVTAINFPVTIGIFQSPNPVIVLRIGHRRFTEQSQVVIDSVLNRFGRQVSQHPLFVVSAIVRHTTILAKRFGSKDPSAVVDIEGDDIGNVRLGGKELNLPTVGNPNRGPGLLRFLGCLRDPGFQWLWLFEIRCRRDGTSADRRERHRSERHRSEAETVWLNHSIYHC